VAKEVCVERRLRYSERKRLAEEGTLGDLEHDDVPQSLRNSIRHLFIEHAKGTVGGRWLKEVKSSCARFFGWPAVENFDYYVREGGSVEEFLDLIEIAVEVGLKKFRYSRQGPSSSFNSRQPQMVFGYSSVEEDLNELFDRHRFGYRLENGEIRRIGSPHLGEAVVGPALLAIQRPGWEEAERAYREAVNHQRGGPDERDDALTSANAAVESALKAAGLQGDRLGPLAKSLRNSDLVPSELKGVPEALDVLLKRQEAIRSNHGDAHGKAPGSPVVPQALADLAIHWAGAFIVFLAETSSSPS
jgi:hypothetical protein